MSCHVHVHVHVYVYVYVHVPVYVHVHVYVHIHVHVMPCSMLTKFLECIQQLQRARVYAHEHCSDYAFHDTNFTGYS